MVIPSINVHTFDEVKFRATQVGSYAQWAHLDIEDGKFANRVTWSEPEDLKTLSTPLSFEAHLMIEKPEEYVEAWLDAGVKRVIAHAEALGDPQSFLDEARRYGAEAGIAINPDTPIEMIFPYAGGFDMVLVMSVFIGPSGQAFIPAAIERVRVLRKRFPDAVIEVDGGINRETARAAKAAGVDHFVAGAYVFSRPDPVEAIKELEEATK